MIKSMTGFGRNEYNDGKRNIVVEIKSVNHRYSDVSVKMPRRYSFAEDKIKARVKEKVRRGKVDVSIMVENITENDMNIKLNMPIASQYYDNLVELKESFQLYGDINLSLLASMPDVMKAIPDVEDEEKMIKTILIPLEEAIKKLENMREIEGQKLVDDLLKKGENIRKILVQMKERSPKVVSEYTGKLNNRIRELIGNNVEIPQDRILVEAAIFADKASIDEEITRLDSHLNQLGKILGGKEHTVGKKLDFLVQEMNREANTIGSKANDIEITNHMLNLKAEIEKIREQVQNIE